MNKRSKVAKKRKSKKQGHGDWGIADASPNTEVVDTNLASPKW